MLRHDLVFPAHHVGEGVVPAGVGFRGFEDESIGGEELDGEALGRHGGVFVAGVAADEEAGDLKLQIAFATREMIVIVLADLAIRWVWIERGTE